MSNSRRRVKLYVLNENRQWIEHGIGHVQTGFNETRQPDNKKGIVVVVRSEENGSVLLESKVLTDTVYQKQQDTLVVWSEGDNNFALSFQEKEGCADIWEKICEVQGVDPSLEITQDLQVQDSEITHEDDEQVQNNDDTFEEVQDFALFELPPCELSKLEEIVDAMQTCLPTNAGKQRLAQALETDNYVKKLIEIFHMCEDLENTEGLHTLFKIFKMIFTVENNALFEIMFQPDVIMDVVGVLENDPAKKAPTPHRKFLNEIVKFKEVIPISNAELRSKIHTTYRVQYIKDVLVPAPSLFDETMSTLTSFLFFNKIDIVNLIQEDSQYLEQLFAQLIDDECFDEKRKDAVLLLKELCNLSQSLQPDNRDSFIQELLERKLLTIIQPLMNLEDTVIRSATVDILYSVAEYNPALIRSHFLKEAKTCDEDSLLLNQLIEMLHSSVSGTNGMDVTLMLLIRSLLDTDSMGAELNKMEKTEFLSFYYRHCMHFLMAPLLKVTNTNQFSGKDDFGEAAVLKNVVEILTFCVLHHNMQMRQYILAKDVLKRVLMLMRSQHKFLALTALRFCRKIVGLKDELYNRYITVGKLFKPIVDAFVSNGERYNLLNSAIIELFEFIRSEDVKTLCSYVVESHYEAFISVEYIATFRGLKDRYDQQKDRESNSFSGSSTPPGIIHSSETRKRRDDRALDEFEENWFDAEDEELTTTADEKPLAAKLKDVDLLDNLPIAPQSPQKDKPTAQNGLKSPPKTPQNCVKIAIVSPQQNFQNKPVVDSPRPDENKFVLRNKPVLSIKINPNSILNSKLNENLNDKFNELKEPVNAKAKLSLVDYPDDDEEDDHTSSDEEITQPSPRKKQRIET